MPFEVRKQAKSLLFILHGNLTEAECGAFHEGIVRNVKGDIQNIYLDMRDLTLIDSVGLGLVMGVKMSCKRRARRLTILSPSESVLNAFSMVKFDQVLDILSEKEAQTVLDANFPEAADFQLDLR